jgi:protein-S-isoprenylcysteine O-methyltransferase Ste14
MIADCRLQISTCNLQPAIRNRRRRRVGSTELIPEAVDASRQPAIAAGNPDGAVARSEGRGLVTARWLDWIERLLVLALYGWLVARLLIGYWTEGGIGNLLLLPSEGLVVLLLLLRRRAAEISQHPGEWLLALAATCVPLLVAPHAGVALVPPIVAAFVLVLGLLVQVHAKLTLGRSIGCVPAHRGLKLAGPYQFVRHPMYAGYLLSHLGFLALNPTLWNLGVYAVCYGLQVPRLLAEERLLSRDPRYREYQAAVRYRLIPGLF